MKLAVFLLVFIAPAACRPNNSALPAAPCQTMLPIGYSNYACEDAPGLVVFNTPAGQYRCELAPPEARCKGPDEASAALPGRDLAYNYGISAGPGWPYPPDGVSIGRWGDNGTYFESDDKTPAMDGNTASARVRVTL